MILGFIPVGPAHRSHRVRYVAEGKYHPSIRTPRPAQGRLAGLAGEVTPHKAEAGVVRRRFPPLRREGSVAV